MQLHSRSCSIPYTDSVIITGGIDIADGNRATAKVAEYTEEGILKENGIENSLPDLNTARLDHACAGYTTESGVKVTGY